MQAVILAAGKGVRMGKLTEDTPKPMLKIKGKPILAHKMEAFPKGFSEAVLVVGYLKEQIVNYFGDSYNGIKITYADQGELHGTGGALHSAKNVLEDKFLVMMADDLYVKKDIEEIMKHDLAVLGHETGEPERFGIIEIGQDGSLAGIIEKPKIHGPALACTGLYMLNKDFFNYPLVTVGNGEYGLPQTMAGMKDKHRIAVVRAADWFPIGNPEDLNKAEEIIDKFI